MLQLYGFLKQNRRVQKHRDVPALREEAPHIDLRHVKGNQAGSDDDGP